MLSSSVWSSAIYKIHLKIHSISPSFFPLNPSRSIKKPWIFWFCSRRGSWNEHFDPRWRALWGALALSGASFAPVGGEVGGGRQGTTRDDADGEWIGNAWDIWDIGYPKMEMLGRMDHIPLSLRLIILIWLLVIRLLLVSLRLIGY